MMRSSSKIAFTAGTTAIVSPLDTLVKSPVNRRFGKVSMQQQTVAKIASYIVDGPVAVAQQLAPAQHKG